MLPQTVAAGPGRDRGLECGAPLPVRTSDRSRGTGSVVPPVGAVVAVDAVDRMRRTVRTCGPRIVLSLGLALGLTTAPAPVLAHRGRGGPSVPAGRRAALPRARRVRPRGRCA